MDDAVEDGPELGDWSWSAASWRSVVPRAPKGSSTRHPIDELKPYTYIYICLYVHGCRSKPPPLVI